MQSLEELERRINTLANIVNAFGVRLDNFTMKNPVPGVIPSPQEKPKPKVLERVDPGETYYFVDLSNGQESMKRDTGTALDDLNWAMGNYSLTQHGVGLFLQRLILKKDLRDFAGPTDWIDLANHCQNKYYLAFNTTTREWEVKSTWILAYGLDSVYFETSARAKEALDTFKKRLAMFEPTPF